MSTNKTLNTSHTLYSNIVRALSPDDVLPRLNALDGTTGTPVQPWHFGHNVAVSGATWTATQGIARNDTHWFSIGTNVLRKYDLVDNLLETEPAPFVGLPAGLNHCGDGFVSDDHLYVIISNYSNGVSTTVVIAKFLTTTLALDSFFDISAQTQLNGSGCSLNANGDEILVTSFWSAKDADARNTDIYRFSKAAGSYIGIHTLSVPSVGIQSITYHPENDHYYIGSHSTSDAEEMIYVYDSSFVFVTKIDPISTIAEMEGVESYGGNIYFNTINAAPRLLDLSMMNLGKEPAVGDPVQFLDNSLMGNDVTILMKVRPSTLFNFNSVFDSQSYTNDWESWIYGDGRFAYRLNASANITHAGIVANQTYLIAYTWSNDGGTVTTQLGVDGIYSFASAAPWITPPANGLWLGGINSSNDQGDNAYGDILVFNKVLSVSELADAQSNFDDFYISNSSTATLTADGIPDGTYRVTIIASTRPSTVITSKMATFAANVSTMSIQAQPGTQVYGLVRDNLDPSMDCAPLNSITI